MSILNRRRFFKLSAGTIIGITAGSVSLSALAAEQLKLDDPLAAAMRYTHKSEVDGQQWRPCAIFPGKLVANEGWCAAWVKKIAA